MKRFTSMRVAATLLIAGALFGPQFALAAGTASGTNITNSATLSYSTGGVSQPAATSNTAAFVVDNLVRVVVAEVNTAHTPVAPGALAQVTVFTVTNTGNTSQDYSLVPTNQPNGAVLTLGATNYTDSWDGTGCLARVESGVTAGYQPGEDTAAAIQGLAADGSRTVYIVCDVPSGLANNVDAIVTLTATTNNAGTCSAAGAGCVTTTQTAGAGTAGTVDVVFGDAAGSDDAARDGIHSARDVYRVVAAVISVTKSATPICDPFNGNTTPKNIPGAYVRYTITIANDASASASAILSTVTDALNAATAIDPDLRTGATLPCNTSAPESAAGSGFRATCPAGRTSCAANIFYTTAAADDAVGISGANVTVTFGDGPAGTKLLPGTDAGYVAGELKAGESVTIRFNVVVQ